MSNTTKPISTEDSNNVLRYAFNDSDRTIAVGGFVATKVGHKVTRTVISALIDDYSFFDSSTLLYTIRVTYNNSSHDEINQVERTV